MTSDEFFDRLRRQNIVRASPRPGQKTGGVSGALSTRAGMTVGMVRFLFLAAMLMSGIGLLAYIVAWVFLPDERGIILAEEFLASRYPPDTPKIVLAFVAYVVIAVSLFLSGSFVAIYVTAAILLTIIFRVITRKSGTMRNEDRVRPRTDRSYGWQADTAARSSASDPHGGPPGDLPKVTAAPWQDGSPDGFGATAAAGGHSESAAPTTADTPEGPVRDRVSAGGGDAWRGDPANSTPGAGLRVPGWLINVVTLAIIGVAFVYSFFVVDKFPLATLTDLADYVRIAAWLLIALGVFSGFLALTGQKSHLASFFIQSSIIVCPVLVLALTTPVYDHELVGTIEEVAPTSDTDVGAGYTVLAADLDIDVREFTGTEPIPVASTFAGLTVRSSPDQSVAIIVDGVLVFVNDQDMDIDSATDLYLSDTFLVGSSAEHADVTIVLDAKATSLTLEVVEP